MNTSKLYVPFKAYNLISKLWVFAFLACYMPLTAQNKSDSLKVKAGKYYILNDSTFYTPKDTLIHLDTEDSILLEQSGEAFFFKLKEKGEKSVFYKILSSYIVMPPPDDSIGAGDKSVEKAKEYYQAYSGRIIRKIKLNKLDVAGQTISDTSRVTVTRIGKAMNAVHVNTRDVVIYSNLLFKPGDTVNPQLLVENIRWLSELRYLRNAFILVHPVGEDSADLEVLTKDRFPFFGLPIIHNSNKISLRLWNENFMGLGHRITLQVTNDTRINPSFYISQATYSVNNIGNSFIQMEGGYTGSRDDYRYFVKAERRFHPPRIKWAGGAEAGVIFRNQEYEDELDSVLRSPFKYNLLDLWTSRLFKSGIQSKPGINPVFFIVGLRYYDKFYSERPSITRELNSRYTSFKSYLLRLAIGKNNYRVTNYLTDFGRREYISYGFQIYTTFGYSTTDFFYAPYLNFGIAKGDYLPKLGFYYFNIEAGSHYFKKELEQGAVKVGFSYISNLYKIRRYKLRLYSYFRFLSGINRVTDDRVFIDNKHGAPGLGSFKFEGQSRMIGSLSTVLFTPWYFYGMRFAVFGFVSGGFVSLRPENLVDQRMVSSIGLGLLLANDFLTFGGFSFRIVFYPNVPEGDSQYKIEFLDTPLINSPDFLDGKPSVIKFE